MFSETSILSTMTRPVASWISGDTVDIDLSPDASLPDGMPIPIVEARQRIARTCGVADGRIRLMDPIGHGILEDHALLGVEVVVMVLSLDPEVERAAVASLLQACNAEDMDSLSQLRELDISESNLTDLPESFSQLTALQTLDMVENELSSLPESFGQLTALQHLNLSTNQLSSLPESFGQLTALQDLNLFANHLSSLPDSFAHLTALQRLDLARNQLTSLPESFGQLTARQHLGQLIIYLQ